MNIEVLPANMQPVTIRIRRKNGKSATGEIAFPPDIIQRYNLKDKDVIVIAYVCKHDEDIRQVTPLVENKN